MATFTKRNSSRKLSRLENPPPFCAPLYRKMSHERPSLNAAVPVSSASLPVHVSRRTSTADWMNERKARNEKAAAILERSRIKQQMDRLPSSPVKNRASGGWSPDATSVLGPDPTPTPDATSVLGPRPIKSESAEKPKVSLATAGTVHLAG